VYSVPQTGKTAHMPAILDITGLQKRFGSTVALTDCNLTVEPGQLVGFIGPNGAGKSTTMRSIMRLVSTDAGTISWAGRPIADDDRRKFGYMPQERGLYAKMQLHEQVAYFGRLAGLDAADASRRAGELLDTVGLSSRGEDMVQDLSVGNQQRVQLAVALVHRPELLVLDEPFAGLDPIAVDVLRDVIVERSAAGVGVLFSSHQLDLVQELCRDVVVINEGSTIASGRVDDLRSSSGDRILEISWAEPSDATRSWKPGDGTLPDENDPDPLTTSDERLFRVDAGADPADLMRSAGAVGTVATFRFGPPSLDDVFTEIVGAQGAVR